MDERIRRLAESVSSRDEFERESQRVERLVLEALAIEPGERVLFCGFGQNLRAIRYAMDAGAHVAVIESDIEKIRDHERLGVEILRGSTSVIPARDGDFDLAVAYHYLHEVDPFFHAQIASELARVARRVVIVEPAPPADALGARIATLYARAKRELGAFEEYRPLEYWRKLMAMVKPEVAQSAVAFTRVPPRAFVRDTIDVLLETMRAEAIPKTDLEELRLLARRPDAQLLPQSRFVITGAVSGEIPSAARRAESGTAPAVAFPGREVVQTPALPAAAAPSPPDAVRAPQPFRPPPLEMPAAAPREPAAVPSPPAPAPIAGEPEAEPQGEPRWDEFGFPVLEEQPPPAVPFAAPFAVPNSPPQPEEPGGIGWQWEPPEPEDKP